MEAVAFFFFGGREGFCLFFRPSLVGPPPRFQKMAHRAQKCMLTPSLRNSTKRHPSSTSRLPERRKNMDFGVAEGETKKTTFWEGGGGVHVQGGSSGGRQCGGGGLAEGRVEKMRKTCKIKTENNKNNMKEKWIIQKRTFENKMLFCMTWFWTCSEPPTAFPLCGHWCAVGVLAGTHQCALTCPGRMVSGAKRQLVRACSCAWIMS